MLKWFVTAKAGEEEQSEVYEDQMEERLGEGVKGQQIHQEQNEVTKLRKRKVQGVGKR